MHGNILQLAKIQRKQLFQLSKHQYLAIVRACSKRGALVSLERYFSERCALPGGSMNWSFRFRNLINVCERVPSGESTNWLWRLRSPSSGSRRDWTAWCRLPFPRAWRLSDGRSTAAWTDLRNDFYYFLRWPLLGRRGSSSGIFRQFFVLVESVMAFHSCCGRGMGLSLSLFSIQWLLDLMTCATFLGLKSKYIRQGLKLRKFSTAMPWKSATATWRTLDRSPSCTTILY